jgi:hypothetical protein
VRQHATIVSQQTGRPAWEGLALSGPSPVCTTRPCTQPVLNPHSYGGPIADVILGVVGGAGEIVGSIMGAKNSPEGLARTLANLQGKLAKTDDPTKRAKLKAKIKSLKATLVQLVGSTGAADQAIQQQAGVAPVPSSSSSSSNTGLFVIGGGVLLLLGCGTVIFLTSSRRRRR